MNCHFNVLINESFFTFVFFIFYYFGYKLNIFLCFGGCFLNKKVKEVFFSLANEDNKFCEANVCEVKFSKKLNAVIVSASSEDNISLFDIERFEKRACKEYDLNSFKVEYRYNGKPCNINEKSIRDIIMLINQKYDYTKRIFENCVINISDEEQKIEIILKFLI